MSQNSSKLKLHYSRIISKSRFLSSKRSLSYFVTAPKHDNGLAGCNCWSAVKSKLQVISILIYTIKIGKKTLQFTPPHTYLTHSYHHTPPHTTPRQFTLLHIAFHQITASHDLQHHPTHKSPAPVNMRRQLSSKLLKLVLVWSVINSP